MTKFKKGQRVIAVGTIVSPRGEFSTDHAVVSFSRDDDHDGFAGSAQCAEIALKDLRPTPQASSEIREALESANDLCRSAMSIAKRDGKDTNWETFRNRLAESLDRQHKVMYPAALEAPLRQGAAKS